MLLTVKAVGDTQADVSMHAFDNELTPAAQNTELILDSSVSSVVKKSRRGIRTVGRVSVSEN